ncbi:MAG TPA: hypothetical protein VLB27_10275, partial [candidate division Zixibacteria bacterium]|nr:hypothetical protein [candidate division Zixibacteria bacterium]
MNTAESQAAAGPFASLDHTGRLPVDPAVINNALNELWESSLSGDSPERSYSRVSLYDLIVVADTTTLQRAEALIQNFARERPSRTIFVCVDSQPDGQSKEQALSAEVGIACG